MRWIFLFLGLALLGQCKAQSIGIYNDGIERLSDSTFIELCKSTKFDVIESFSTDYYPLKQPWNNTKSLFYQSLGLTFFYDSTETIQKIKVDESANAIYYQNVKNIILGETEFRYIIMENDDVEGVWSTSNGSFIDWYDFTNVSYGIQRPIKYDENKPYVMTQIEQLKAPVVSIFINCIKKSS